MTDNHDKKLPAKLSRPRQAGSVLRERLFAIIDADRERPLTWIVGPPGSGKTTLVTTYLRHAGMRTVWYRVDAGDADLATTFHYLTQATQTAAHRRSVRLPPLTPEYLPDLVGYMRRYFRTMFAALPAASALVLDSYENAPPSSLDELVKTAVAEAPPGIRIFITSRMEPPFELGHLHAKGMMAQIPWPDLRLSVSEAQAIAGSTEDGATVAALHERSGGWAAGFVVLLDFTRRFGAIDVSARGGYRESLFQYFAAEPFARTETEVRDLLLRTALLPDFSAEQAIALSGNDRAGLVLDRLHRAHYFIDRTIGRVPLYRFHALFRDFLLDQGRAAFGPELRTELLLRAAKLLVEAHRSEESLPLFTEAGAHAEAARLIGELAPVWLRQGRHAVLDNAIDALPAIARVEMPWLSYWLGIARLPFAPAAARELLESAHAAFVARDDTVACLLACSGVLQSYFLEWGDLHPINRWVAAMKALLEREPVFPSEEAEIQVLASLHVLSYAGGAHVDLRDHACARAYALLDRTADTATRLMLANFIAFVLLYRGDYLRLRRLIEDIDGTFEPSEVAPALLLHWLLIKATHRVQSAAPLEALQEIRRAESLARESGVRTFDGQLAMQAVYASLDCGDFVSAEKHVATFRAALGTRRLIDVAAHEFFDSTLALVRGDLDQALRSAREAVRISAKAGVDVGVVLSRINVSLAHLARCSYGAALEELTEVVRISTGPYDLAFGYTARMLQAYTLLQTQKEHEALPILREALATAREKEYRALPPWAPPWILAPLCAVALEAGIEVGYVRDLISRRRLAPPDPGLELWPWPVRIHALGRFEVRSNDQPLKFMRKAQRKPLELLKTIVAGGGRTLSQDELIDALWPQAPEDGGRKVFDVTVHRLRRLLGNHEAVEISDRHVALNRAVVWVDVFAVEQILSRTAPGVVGQPAPDEIERLGAKLLSLYGGALLPGEQETAPIVAARERLSGRFRRFVRRLGDHWERRGRWSEAADLYRHAIELDPLAEGIYQRLMLSLHRQGQSIEAIEVYRRCRRRLSVVLGVKPTRDTEALYAEILTVSRG